MWSIPARAPLAAPAVLLSLGVLAGYAAGARATAVAALSLGAALLSPRGRDGLLALALGLLAGAEAQVRRAPEAWVRGMTPGLYALAGVVVEAPPPSRYARRVVLAVDRIGEGSAALAVRIRVRLTARRGVWPESACTPGARVAVLARLERTGRVRAPLQGVVPAREAVRVERPARPLGRMLQATRMHVADVFDRYLGFRDAGLARAIVAGDRERLGYTDRLRFQQADQVHLLAVSGMHVALVIGGLVALLRLLGLALVPTHVIGLLAIAFYVPFTGASPSSLRAGLGAALFLLAPLLGRTLPGLAVIPPVLLLTFAFDGAAFTRLGLWLSLAAVVGILVLAPPLAGALVRPALRLPNLEPEPRAWIRRGLAVGFGAWCATLPFVADRIGRMCLLAAPLSVFAGPFLVLLIGSALVLIAVSEVPPLAHAVATVFAHAADGLRLLLDLPRVIGLDAARVAPPRIGWHVAYVLSLFGIATHRGRGTLGWLVVTLVLAGALTLREAGPSGSARPRYDAAPASTWRAAPTEERMDGLTLLAAAGGLLAFAVFSVRPMGWLTPPGAAGAWVLGTASAWRFGWPGLFALLATFLVTTGLSKLPGRHRSGARTLRQVVANGAGPMAGCVVSVLGFPLAGAGAFLAGLAFLGADTTSSEIGVRYGGPPRRLRSKERIAPGQSGGITPVGSIAGALGGLIPPVVAGLSGTFHIGVVLWIGLAGLLGAIVDSWLGDTVQYRGLSPETGSITEAREVDGVESKPFSGYRWLDNDGVNLLSGLATAALGVLLIHLA